MTESDTGNTGINQEQLKGFVTQIVMSEREKKGIQEDIRAYYAAAKDAGFDVETLRRAVKWDMASPAKRQEMQVKEDTFDRYLQVLGIFE